MLNIFFVYFLTAWKSVTGAHLVTLMDGVYAFLVDASFAARFDV